MLIEGEEGMNIRSESKELKSTFSVKVTLFKCLTSSTRIIITMNRLFIKETKDKTIRLPFFIDDEL